MAIIISKNGKNAEKLDQSNFELEDKLQEYIYDNPDTIPLYDIDEDTRLFIAAREFSTRSGPIDALGFDASGNIYVIETKLYKNPDKRTVVAQALDYGASLWRHSVDFDDFVRQLNAHCTKQFGQSFSEKYAEFFQTENIEESLQTIKNNLTDGRIKFVVLMDRLHDALKDLVVFVNQNSKFDVYAVELEYYKHESFEIIIPKLYGAEVKKEVTSTSSGTYSRRPLTQEELLSRLDTDEQRIALALINTASLSNKIGISWRKTGFSLWTMIPRELTENIYNYEAGYSYLLFQASQKGDEVNKLISFWYPESSYDSLPKLQDYVSRYRNTYHSHQSYDAGRKEISLQNFNYEDAQQLISSMTETARRLGKLDIHNKYDKEYPR